MPLPQGYEWNQEYSNYGSIHPPSRDEIETEKEEFSASEQLFEEWDWQGETGPQGEALPELAIGWKPNGEADFGTGLQGWWNKAVSNVRSSWKTGYEEGIKISGLTEKAIVLASTAGKGKEAIQEGEENVAKINESLKPENENQALWSAATEATKEVFNQGLWGLLDGLSYAGQFTEQVIGTAGYTLADAIDPDRDVSAETFKDNWNASRLAYSGIFDASIYEEMNRRIDQGIRPDLAQQEIMIEKKWTMWPELIGQVIFDPLNVVTSFTKAGQAIKLEKTAAKTFHEVSNPAVLKMLDDIQELSKLDDATAYQRIDELVKSQQALTTAASHAADIADAGKDMETLSNSYKLASLTRDGKIAHVANETGEILMHVVNNSSPDEALEIIRGMVKSASKNADEAAEGISAMLHFADPKALFSKAGNDTTVMLARMAEKYGDTWLKNIDALKNDPVALTQDLMSKLDEVGEEMFPSVSKMLEAEKAVKAGGETSEATRALADRAAQLPQYVRNATRFHDAAQKVVGPINKFFIGAYMGWSPGFAFRNFSNNSLQLLIDYGPGVLLGKADDMYAKASKLHGGALWGVTEDTMEASLFKKKGTALSSYQASQEATDAGAILQAAKNKGLSGPVLGMSQKLEANAAKRIIAKTYRQTFDKGVKAMTKALTPALKEAGFSDDIIRKLPTYIENFDGDAKAVINALRQDVASGVIDLFNDISRIDPKYKSFLSDAGKWDEYAEQVLRAPTREAAQAAAQKIFDDMAQAADYAYRDARPAVDNYDKFFKMAERNGLPETRGQLISLRKTESRKAIQVAEQILSEADDLGAALGLQVGTLKRARGITGLNTWGNDAAKEADRLADLAWKLTEDSKGKGRNLNELWQAYPEFFPGQPPASLDAKAFRDALWAQFDVVTSKTWGGARDAAIDSVTGYLDDLERAGAQIPPQWKETIKAAQEGAQQYDNAMIGRFGELVEETAMPYGSRTSQINALAKNAGIPTATAEGIATDKKTLAVINKYADVSYKSLEDVPLDVAKEAFAKKAGKAARLSDEAAELAPDPDLPHYDDAGNLVQPARKRILPPPTDGEMPTIARAIHEQMDEVTRMRKWVMDDIASNYGKKQLTNKVADSALNLAEKELTQKLAETKLISSRVAQANRDFTLLNYGRKSYWDVAAAYLYPFHFWYKGTYANWMKRIVQNPAVLAHYGKYKDILGTVHAGMPDWWKYNLNTNDLPGVDVENPMYFNLEATLWPLNGITGTDFNDRSKVTNWWTHYLDFANKFGPSTWTPISMMTGLALYNQGEQEAGLKWMGRAIPQSATVKAVASQFGIGNLETDPIVKIFGENDLDPYEQRRVARALAAMEQEALRGDLPYTQEQIQDAAYNQDGEIWDEAVKRAVRGRSASQISSYLFGVGFKGRTNEDQEVDQFYQDYGKLYTMRPNLSPEEFKEGMDALKSKYPFADTMLLSGKDSKQRDAGLAYLIMSRIPPGKSSDIAKAVGIDSSLLDKFFADKGDINKWNAADRQKFMSGVLTMAAVLEIPSDMTRAEWTQAKNAYSKLSTEAKDRFGEDILDQVDAYYAAKTNGTGTDFLDDHPTVTSYMDWKAQRIMNSPLLSAYYGGASQIEGYYRSQMYSAIETELGKEIFDIVDEYNTLKTYEPGEARTFYNQNKAKIRQYYKLKDDWAMLINQQTAQLAAQIPEGQGAGIREDIDATSPSVQNLANELQPEEAPTFEDFQRQVPERLMNLIIDYYSQNEPLPEPAQRQLDRVANDLGYEYGDDLLQAIGVSLYAQNP